MLFGSGEEFDVDIPDDPGKQFSSVGNVAEGIRLLLGRKRAADPSPA
jgi:hypothetical protein